MVYGHNTGAPGDPNSPLTFGRTTTPGSDTIIRLDLPGPINVPGRLQATTATAPGAPAAPHSTW